MPRKRQSRAQSQQDGAASARERIVAAAADLIFHNSGNGTSVDQILAAAEAGKSQFYHYFGSKDALLEEVVRHHRQKVLEMHAGHFARLDSLAGMQAWFDFLVEIAGQSDVCKCPVSAMLLELGHSHEPVRRGIAHLFDTMRGFVVGGLEEARARGELRDDADIDSLATFVVASLKGGMVLAAAQQSAEPLQVTLRHTMAYLRSFASAG